MPDLVIRGATIVDGLATMSSCSALDMMPVAGTMPTVSQPIDGASVGTSDSRRALSPVTAVVRGA